VQPTTALRRLAYRSAYVLLRGYWFLRRPQKLGVKCLLTDGQQVLLVRHTYGHSDEWDLPGGSVKRGEAPVAAAGREIKEELGVAVEDWQPLGQMFGHVNHRRDRLHCFQAELRDALITIDYGELAEARWFARAELPPKLGRYVTPILGRLRSG
jgi:8-oxo-dGTP pyrophosphatase MutT (NUDIX family)